MNSTSSGVPPSTPIHQARPKLAAFAFPGLQVNAQLAAGSMKAAASPSGTFSSLTSVPYPSKPMVSFADERSSSHDRKRNRRALQDDSAIEEIMSQITMKLTTLSTESSTSRQDSIVAFLAVLGCSDHEAQFYLESSDWDIQTAVSLYLENNPHPMTSFDNNPLTTSIMQTEYYCVPSKTIDTKFQWRDRVVEIVGLDPSWEARVNPYDGHIFFRSKITGISQKNVPPGFADIADELMQASVHSSPMDSHPNQMMDETDLMSSSQSISTNYTNTAVCGSSGGGAGSSHISRQGTQSTSPGASVFSENSYDPIPLHASGPAFGPATSSNLTLSSSFYQENEAVSLTHDHRLAQAVDSTSPAVTRIVTVSVDNGGYAPYHDSQYRSSENESFDDDDV